MEPLINKINSKLKTMLVELKNDQGISKEQLDNVQMKINEKIEEARNYKKEIEETKEKIKKIENDIDNSKSDLKELTDIFGNKNLNSLIEAGNKEINSKISDNQNTIAKLHTYISELTDKARMIKDLLINLRKDKDLKDNQLQSITSVLVYYEKRFNDIIDYSQQNSNNLGDYQEKKYNLDNYEQVFEDIDDFDHDEKKSDELNSLVEEEKDVSNLDFEAINKSIDEEYDNIFGNKASMEVKNANSLHEELSNIRKSMFDSITENEENSESLKDNQLISEEPQINNLESELINYLTPKDIDYYNFKVEDQTYLQTIFDKIKFDEIINALNSIDLDKKYIYLSPKIFAANGEELQKNINLLLEAGQKAENIGYIINILPEINSSDLSNIINSYGEKIKDADIADIIIKAKHLGGDK